MNNDININDTIGFITVLEQTSVKEKSRNKYINKTAWICKCNFCDNLFTLKTGMVNAIRLNKSYARKSCGCKAFTNPHKNSKVSPKQASINSLLNRYKQSAKKRLKNWSLSNKEFQKIIFNNCYYCAEPPSKEYNVAISKNNYTQRVNKTFVIKHGTIKYNGIDRIDNTKGYENSNCIPCCNKCNTAKLDMSQKEFIELINKIYNNLVKEG